MYVCCLFISKTRQNNVLTLQSSVALIVLIFDQGRTETDLGPRATTNFRNSFGHFKLALVWLTYWSCVDKQHTKFVVSLPLNAAQGSDSAAPMGRV